MFETLYSFCLTCAASAGSAAVDARHRVPDAHGHRWQQPCSAQEDRRGENSGLHRL